MTVDEKNWGNLEGPVLRFLDVLPQAEVQPAVWSVVSPQNREGMVVPSRVNYVGKGADLYELGYDYSGSVHVITHFLRTSWLWDQVRVQGGAYGAMCAFDRLSGGLTFVSYRDPNLLQTLDAFDRTAAFLSDLALERAELTQSIIGAIGDIDPYRLPDAKGFASLQRHLIGVTDEARQRMRDEVLSTTQHDFKSFAEILQQFKEHGIVKVLGSESSIRQANETHGDFLTVFNVL